MEDRKQEIIEVDNNDGTVSKCNTYSGEDMVNMMTSAVSLVNSMAQQIAQNNAEKYKAQANVLIAEIEKEKQNESEEIKGYYELRMTQEGKIKEDIEYYQNQMSEAWKRALESQNEEERQGYMNMYEKAKNDLNQQLENKLKEVTSEQNTRIANSRPRNKGLFGFLKRKL